MRIGDPKRMLKELAQFQPLLKAQMHVVGV